MDEMKFIPADTLIDEVYGKIGTPERDAMEARLAEELSAAQIGEAIREARIGNKLTQQQLGDMAGVNRSQVSMAERGTSITMATLSKLLRAMGLQARLTIPTVGEYAI